VGRRAKSPGASRTEVETPYVLEALAAVASTDNDHDVLHQISGVITARGGPLTARNGTCSHRIRSSDELPTSSVQDIVECRSRCRIPKSCSGRAPLRARVAEEVRRNLPRRERRPRPSPRRAVENIYAVVVLGAFAAADYHDLAHDERR
jgi:hypothetical protein